MSEQKDVQKVELTEPTSINLTISNEDKVEKSTFERAIIEAFKQNNPGECMKKLSIALDEVKYLVEEIKASKGTKYLLNKNLIDKLSRIIERRFFNVNILIGKIYDSLLETSNFAILSSNLDLLISFSNEILNILDIVKSTNVARSLEKKCSCFLNYLLNHCQPNLDDEQKEIIKELLNSFPTRNCSIGYKTFQSTKDKIIGLCKSNTIDDKIEGIVLLMESISDTNSLEEQFDLLLEYCPQIIKAAIHQPNPENRKVYYQLGNFIISLLFSYKYKIDSTKPIIRETDDNNEPRHDSKSQTFFLVDSSLPEDKTKDKIKIESNNNVDVSYLHNSLYELTTQKDTLLKCENIFTICNLIVNTLSIYETIFELQYVCYIILKRIFFSFPQFKKQIEDLIAVTLVNLCMFKSKEERDNTIDCRQFLHYLLNSSGEESLKEKLKHRIESKGSAINIQLEEGIKTDVISVEYDCLRFNDFNLRIGYPNVYQVEASSQYDKYIEIEEANSLVYIGFATHAYDINLHLLKYINDNDSSSSNILDDDITDKGHFTSVFQLNRIDCSEIPVKIVMFVRSPGIYKLIFDNSYSWITAKTIRHRLSVLRPLTEINYDQRVSNQETNRKVDNQKKEFHSNKHLMVKYEGRMQNYDCGAIEMRKEIIVKEQTTSVYLPVLLTKDSIRLVNWTQDEHGNSLITYENLLQENEQLSLETFETTIEDYIIKSKYLEEASGIKTIYLNVFINEKSIAQSDNISMSSNEHIKSSITKIGFYPGNLISKYNQVKYSCNNLADSCLLYTLYEKVLQEKKLASLIHIHFDSKGALASFYTEGAIQEKISGFNYDNTKDLQDNIDNIIDFINKIIVLFGSFDLSISYTDIGNKVFREFTNKIQERLEKIDTKIQLEQYDQSIIDDMFRYVGLFSSK